MIATRESRCPAALLDSPIFSRHSHFYMLPTDACCLQLAANGGLQCNPLSVTAFTTLLAAAGPCDQQNAADSMIDLAHQLNSDANMIKFTQIFVQQPRNTPDSLSVPYCQQAPRNAELQGLFQCQFQGANPTVFVGNVNVGGAGTIPFGLNTPLSPAGSCPAHTQGPIADGTQLTDTIDSPGVVYVILSSILSITILIDPLL